MATITDDPRTRHGTGSPNAQCAPPAATPEAGRDPEPVPTVRRWSWGRRAGLVATLVALLVMAFVANLVAGAVTVEPQDVLSTIAHHMGIGDGPGMRIDNVIWQIRLPRALLAALVGAALAAAGTGLQAVFRNPLAEPSVIGVSGGAAAGAVAAIVAGVALAGVYTVPLAAFVGALSATGLVFMTARHGARTDAITLVLAGVAVSVIAGAATGLATFVADDQQLRDIVFWTLGSLAGATWPAVIAVAPLIAMACLALCTQARSLDVLALGDREAGHLGLPVTRVRAIVVTLAALATGAAVAVAGIVGFIGLVVPHITRLVVGPGHRTLLPASIALGAAVLLAADLAARTLVVPSELPLGVVTALVGGPYFLWLIRRQQAATATWA